MNMKLHEAHAVWKGDLKSGEGELEVGSGALQGPYDFESRFGEGSRSTPEELLGAAHAGCFSMALSKLLTDEGHEPRSIDTRAKVRLANPENGEPSIEQIDLTTIGDVPGIDRERFAAMAERARTGCVLSRALSATTIRLDAKLAN